MLKEVKTVQYLNAQLRGNYQSVQQFLSKTYDLIRNLEIRTSEMYVVSSVDSGMHEFYVLYYLLQPVAYCSYLLNHNPERAFICQNPQGSQLDPWGFSRVHRTQNFGCSIFLSKQVKKWVLMMLSLHTIHLSFIEL